MMFRSTIFLLLALTLCVTAQEVNHSRRRVRPLRRGKQQLQSGRLRTTTPTPVVDITQTPQPPTIAPTPPPVDATPQQQQIISAPQVIIQLVSGTQTPIAAAPQTVVAAEAKPSVTPVTTSSPLKATPTPVQLEKEIDSYEANQVPEANQEPEVGHVLEVGSEFEDKPGVQPESAPVSKPELETLSYPIKIRPQLTFVPVPEDDSKPATIKSPPATELPITTTQKPIVRYTHGTTYKPIYTASTQLVTKAPPLIATTTRRATKAPVKIASTLAPQRIDSFKLNFVCNEGRGYYPVDNECDSYIQCKNNQAIKYWCPDGLHFNPAAKRNEYPCAYPSVVPCSTGIQRQNPRPTGQCPRQYGFFAMNDGDCSKYLMCQEGEATIMPCPAGLVFNPTVESCDYLENVPQCNPNVFKDYTCPEPPLDEDGFVSDIVYKYKYGLQCKLYIACQRGYPRLLSCERGLAFDESSQSCVDEEYVQDCATPHATWA